MSGIGRIIKWCEGIYEFTAEGNTHAPVTEGKEGGGRREGVENWGERECPVQRAQTGVDVFICCLEQCKKGRHACTETIHRLLQEYH